MNVSERLFDQICRNRGYRVESIPCGTNRTADRRVTANNVSAVFEIKELTPSDDDVRQVRELQTQKWTSGGGTPGRRVRLEIQSGAPQLKEYRDLGIPTALVLYDNIVVNGDRPGARNVHLEAWQIDCGMYGLQTVRLEMPSGRWLGDGRGGKRQLTRDQRRYISAICVLYEEFEALWVYHNYFASVPFPVSLFNEPQDRHFAKAAHPDTSPQVWQPLWPAV